jgi:hypothetical protein
VELTPCGHRNDKNRIYAAKEVNQNLKVEETLFANRKTQKNVPSN